MYSRHQDQGTYQIDAPTATGQYSMIVQSSSSARAAYRRCARASKSLHTHTHGHGGGQDGGAHFPARAGRHGRRCERRRRAAAAFPCRLGGSDARRPASASPPPSYRSGWGVVAPMMRQRAPHVNVVTPTVSERERAEDATRGRALARMRVCYMLVLTLCRWRFAWRGCVGAGDACDGERRYEYDFLVRHGRHPRFGRDG